MNTNYCYKTETRNMEVFGLIVRVVRYTVFSLQMELTKLVESLLYLTDEDSRVGVIIQLQGQ